MATVQNPVVAVARGWSELLQSFLEPPERPPRETGLACEEQRPISHPYRRVCSVWAMRKTGLLSFWGRSPAPLWVEVQSHSPAPLAAVLHECGRCTCGLKTSAQASPDDGAGSRSGLGLYTFTANLTTAPLNLLLLLWPYPHWCLSLAMLISLLQLNIFFFFSVQLGEFWHVYTFA